MSFEEIGQQFLKMYYSKFDADRANISMLYTQDSMLTFEGEQFKGVTNIIGKYSTFNKITHKISKFDIQPSVAGGVICFVTGEMFIDDSPNPLMFSQVFHVCKGANGYFCLNDIFRLNLAN